MRSNPLNLIVVASLAACGSESSRQPVPNDTSGEECRTGGDIGSRTQVVDTDVTRATCWSNDTIYVLNPKADGSYVKVKAGATLTIQPGTTIRGNAGSALVVVRGARIVAEGTAEQPIVFTSNKAAGSRGGGDWGGLLILGAAPTNWDGNDQLFEALPQTESDGRYGGDVADDDSGVLTYVRIEFAGFEYDTDKEFNGLTLAGVGSGTRIDHVQVHRSSDDGVELFGGTVDLKYVVSTMNEDDGFDTDNGWSGRAQFLVVQHLNGKSSDPNGYESDGHKSDFDALPRTSPTIFNATLVGDPAQTKPHFGALLRRGAVGRYANHIFVDFASAGVEVRNTESASEYPSALRFEHTVFFNNAADGSNWSGSQVDFDEQLGFRDASLANLELDPLLRDPTSVTAPDFRLAPTSPVLSAGATPPSDGFFDVTATFVGAIGTEDWTAGWTAYPES